MFRAKVRQIFWTLAVSCFLGVQFNALAATDDAFYDELSRLRSRSYGNGQQTITYTYDPAGNILSRTITIAEKLPPTLVVTTPINGAVVTTAALGISGTATDTQGASGIASVTVNDLAATGGTATGSTAANWTFGASLAPGTNNFTVVATDASPWANQATQSFSVVYLPPIIDGDNDGIPDAWETANNLTDPSLDADSDGISNRDEYKAGTNPQSGASRPEGAAGINYVYFRDHFTDAQYADRWYLGVLDVDAFPTLSEAGTELTATLQRPGSAGCKTAELRSFATVDAAQAVYRARLTLAGYGRTMLGLRKDQDPNNQVELVLDADATPYAQLRSTNGGVLASIPGVTGPYQGQGVDVRIIKNGATWTAFVNQVQIGTVVNAGVGDVALRPYLGLESCLDDAGNAESRVDIVELLRDSDADGLADTREDRNANGAADAGESNRLVADSDADGLNDGFDNCALVANTSSGAVPNSPGVLKYQLDTDGDGYGNACDTDLNNSGLTTAADYAILRSVINQVYSFSANAAKADINGSGSVTAADYAILRSRINAAPGPSGLVP